MTAASSWAALAGSWLLFGLVIVLCFGWLRRHAGPWCSYGHRLNHPDAICGECEHGVRGERS